MKLELASDDGWKATAGIEPEYVGARRAILGPAIMKNIKRALVTSRLTLTDHDAGSNPYDSGRGRNPGSVWLKRSR